MATIRRLSLVFLLIGYLLNPLYSWAKACDGVGRIALKQSVLIDDTTRKALQTLPTLRVVSVNAPPLTSYNNETERYSGIAVDILCFIAREVDLKLSFLHTEHHTAKERIDLIGTAAADIFMPLSLQPERAARGLFTDPYYENYYAAIGREHEEFLINGLMDLRPFRVGVVEGSSFASLLRDLMPPGNLHEYPSSTMPGGLFPALQNGEIDIAVYNKSIFAEKRYRHDLFDLVVLDTLYEQPRAYRYYVQNTPEHHELVQTINRYLAAVDATEAIRAHHNGEQQFIERYVTQRSQRLILLIVIGVGALLLVASYLVSRRYKRLTTLLERRNLHIQEQRRALEKANAELAALTHTDELTQLANRRFFNDTLQREYSRWQRTGASLSVLVVDIDFFKLVNDHFGHMTGDDYLRTLARVLETSVQRSTDLVARPGGEEFACILPNTNIYDARLIAQRIQRNLARLGLSNPLADNPVLTVSIGIATLVSGDFSMDSLLSHADQQMYHVKRTGRNGVSWVELTADGPQQPA